MKKIKITTTVDGPYKIVNIKKVIDSSGKSLCDDEEAWLCRCGDSSNKPFCDGTHAKNSFSGEQDSEFIQTNTKAYIGKNITIYDNRSICAHRGYCAKELPSVFKETKPWIDPDGDTVEKIMALCNKCPSGALTYALPEQERVLGMPTDDTIIRLAEKHHEFHGPYDVKGEVELDGQLAHQPESPLKTTLCRCGHSKNKPFCSGEHFHIKFIDDKNE